MKNLFICLGALLLLGLYLSSKLDWEDMLQPRSKTPVHLDGKIAPKPKSLPGVQLISIPQEVFADLSADGWSRYVTGNQKYVLVITWGGKPAPAVFKKTLKTLFKQKGYAEYYRKHFVTVPGNSWFVSCNSYHMCPKLWLYQNCIQKVCLINPSTKQVVIDSSADANQLEQVLEKYKEW